MGVWPHHQRPSLNKNEHRITCHNGAVIRYMSADEPERFRGPQADGAWADEVDAWKPRGMSPTEAWALFELGIRLGPDPRIVVTSTPKRARLVKALQQRPDAVLTTGTTWDNRANLSSKFLTSVVGQYGGTHLGRQEIEGLILEDVEGALVDTDLIDRNRVLAAPDLRRTVVGVDPSGTVSGDAQGIVVVGRGADGHGYVLADRSCSLSPEGWGSRAVETAAKYDADCIAVEVNYGGDMCASVIEQAAHARGVHVRVKKVTATKAKHVRFEPVALLYEQGRLHHAGNLGPLEGEITGFTVSGYEGDGSPNRVDALVWAVTELVLARSGVSPDDLYAQPQEGAPC
jgi:phage terminase large subunit-like protein